MVGDGSQRKIRKAHPCVHAHAMTGLHLNHFLECFRPTQVSGLLIFSA